MTLSNKNHFYHRLALLESFIPFMKELNNLKTNGPDPQVSRQFENRWDVGIIFNEENNPIPQPSQIPPISVFHDPKDFTEIFKNKANDENEVDFLSKNGVIMLQINTNYSQQTLKEAFDEIVKEEKKIGEDFSDKKLPQLRYAQDEQHQTLMSESTTIKCMNDLFYINADKINEPKFLREYAEKLYNLEPDQIQDINNAYAKIKDRLKALKNFIDPQNRLPYFSTSIL